MSRDKDEEEAWGRLAGWKLAARVGVRICPACCTHYSIQHPAAAGVCRLTEQAKQWTSYSAATDGPEMDLVEARRSSTWSPQDLACAGVGD